ncbi:MAG: hypothetical protein RL552_705, partial [Actinomycetota bacterium]
MPPFVRWAYFKVLCKRYGRRVLLDYDTYIRYPHKVSIGNDVAINRGCRIYPSLLTKTATITLEDEIDISRGDMIVRPGNVPKVEQKFDAMVVWMSEDPMVPGKSYWIKQATKAAPGMISTLRYQIDVNSLHRVDSPTLRLNEIGRCSLTLNQPVAFDAYRRNRSTGSFIVIDRVTNAT